TTISFASDVDGWTISRMPTSRAFPGGASGRASFAITRSFFGGCANAVRSGRKHNHQSRREKNMGKVARQVVEQAGVNVDVLIDKLVRAAGAEFTTFYYYTILRVNSSGFEAECLKEIIEDARIEDGNHFEALTPRILELGAALPRDIRQFAD